MIVFFGLYTLVMLVMLEKGSIEAESFGLPSLSYLFFASVHRWGAGDA
jgi:hypothetical protein